MTKLIRLAVLLLATAFAMQAHAQRVSVPLVDFANIPVADATDKPVTAEQVRTAFIRAGSRRRWEVKPVSEGVLEATYVKENKHTVVVRIDYTATHYSLTYKDSTNMRYETVAVDPVRNLGAQQAGLRANAASRQQAHFANDPSTRYAVVHRAAELHPFYENWVRNLLADVRLELKLA